jgi:hypothetical protein
LAVSFGGGYLKFLNGVGYLKFLLRLHHDTALDSMA